MDWPLILHGALMTFAPLIDMIEAFSRAKLSLHRIQLTVWLYSVLLFSLIMVASLLQNVVAALPIPSVTDKTSGVKVVCSTSRILCSYCHLFSCSCHLYADVSGLWQFDLAQGLNILTSINAFLNRPPPPPKNHTWQH